MKITEANSTSGKQTAADPGKVRRDKRRSGNSKWLSWSMPEKAHCKRTFFVEPDAMRHALLEALCYIRRCPPG